VGTIISLKKNWGERWLEKRNGGDIALHIESRGADVELVRTKTSGEEITKVLGRTVQARS